MRNNKKTLLIGLLVAVSVMAVSVLQSVMHTSEACRSVREEIHQYASNDSSLAWLLSAVPERVMNRALDDRYAALSDAECTALMPQITADREALSHASWAAQMHPAGEASITAITQCHAKRVRGEIKTHAESAQCSNPQIIAAYQHAGYPYIDLVEQITAKRMELAQGLDKLLFEREEDQSEFAKLTLAIAEQERARLNPKK